MSQVSAVESGSERAVQQPVAAPSWLVTVCIVAIAVSLGSILYLQAPVSWPVAAGAGLLSLAVLSALRTRLAQKRERAALDARLHDLERTADRMAEDLGRTRSLLQELQTAFDTRLDEAVEMRFGLLSADMQLIEARLDELGTGAGQIQPLGPGGTQHPQAAQPDGQALRETTHGADDHEEMARVIRSALSENRLDLLLQPVVSLPQRHVRYYEAISHVRGDGGESVAPAAYLPVAQASGLMPLIDSSMLWRCVQIVRRMNGRSRDVAIICNLSPASLVDGDFFPQFLRYLAEKRELAGSLIFEFSQSDFDALGPLERSSLDVLIELGFRFSLDGVSDLDIDGAAYAARRVCLMKIESGILLDPRREAGAQIHLADLAALLARSGIDLVAAKVETEAELVDLIDYDIRLAQGNLFSPPRPVRGEFLADAPPVMDWASAS